MEIPRACAAPYYVDQKKGTEQLREIGKRLLAFRDLQKTAGLQTTADNVPPFLAVEIIEGTPNKGDKVALDESRPLEPAGE